MISSVWASVLVKVLCWVRTSLLTRLGVAAELVPTCTVLIAACVWVLVLVELTGAIIVLLMLMGRVV